MFLHNKGAMHLQALSVLINAWNSIHYAAVFNGVLVCNRLLVCINTRDIVWEIIANNLLSFAYQVSRYFTNDCQDSNTS